MIDNDFYASASQQFVADEVDLIVAFPNNAATAAKAATEGTDIPVVFTLCFTDIPGDTLIDSVQAPGANITGTRFPSTALASKRFEIMMELVPNAKRVFVPNLIDYPNVPPQIDAIKAAAGAQSATLADKVLTGTPAGTIPVLTAESYFKINVAAAEALGVTVPESLLLLADEVITE